MNDQIASLLNDLAVKLGTTVEYLWASLLKQAKIEATVQLVMLVATWVALLATAAAMLRWYRRGISKTGENFAIPITIVWVVGAMFALVTLFVMPCNIFTGLFNPDYWALQKVLSLLK